MEIELSSGPNAWRGRVRDGRLELQAGEGRRITATRIGG
jgi:hypothetical protein